MVYTKRSSALFIIGLILLVIWYLADSNLLSPLFQTTKNKKKLGIIKFNNLSRLTNKPLIALGGINENNIRQLKLINVKGFAGISIDVNEGIKAKPIISDLELHGINFNGMVYNLTKKGLKKV